MVLEDAAEKLGAHKDDSQLHWKSNRADDKGCSFSGAPPANAVATFLDLAYCWLAGNGAVRALYTL